MCWSAGGSGNLNSSNGKIMILDPGTERSTHSAASAPTTAGKRGSLLRPSGGQIRMEVRQPSGWRCSLMLSSRAPGEAFKSRAKPPCSRQGALSSLMTMSQQYPAAPRGEPRCGGHRGWLRLVSVLQGPSWSAGGGVLKQLETCKRRVQRHGSL